MDDKENLYSSRAVYMYAAIGSAGMPIVHGYKDTRRRKGGKTKAYL